ncbi:ABC transporter ATP-binding protein [Paenibacillus donghaensis]|uniref:ABC transporter ATP-binding protein n=1 Tax=Paenibacillus donghaensis TaxID=414771 RepID=A0A2Z2KKA8_9BACL|nr:ABC transporter ATP-binding protein [Paenibacillus donghaensis]ASA26457.1 ABC transporter ATP-binding protein [Paenibacillus donghaensis]
MPRLLEIAGEKRGLLLLAGILSSASAVLMLVPFISVYFILAELLRHAAAPAQADGALMITWGWIALYALILGLVLSYAGIMCSHIAAFRIQYQLRIKMTEHLGRLPLGYLTGTSTGTVKKTLEQNVDKVENFIAHKLPDLISAVVTTVLMIGAMFWLSPPLALACLLPIAAGFAVQSMLMTSRKGKASAKQYYDSLEQINASAVQYVRGMPAVKVFGQTVHSFRKFYSDMVSYRDYCLQFTDRYQNGYILFKTLLVSPFTFILPVGVFLLDGSPDAISFALVLLFFLVMAPGVSTPLFKLMMLASSTRDIGEGVERMDRLLAQTPVPETAIPQSPQSYEIEFSGVTFSYHPDGTAAAALHQVSFRAEQGRVTALVGPSGSGKSTVASLVPRFWDPQAGSITIGGVDIRNMAVAELMNTVAFVFQETFLFYDTFYENIAVGKPGATLAEVQAAARAAQCDDFITRLPHGYDTLIGEGGVYLSGGEEQRIAVARAILKNAPILVLDEATAFADPENEHRMQLALTELMRGKTVLVIAHRLSSIREAAQILVLQEGEIIERGTHDSLLLRQGQYARMWEIYTDAGEWHIERAGGSR